MTTAPTTTTDADRVLAFRRAAGRDPKEARDLLDAMRYDALFEMVADCERWWAFNGNRIGLATHRVILAEMVVAEVEQAEAEFDSYRQALDAAMSTNSDRYFNDRDAWVELGRDVEEQVEDAAYASLKGKPKPTLLAFAKSVVTRLRRQRTDIVNRAVNQ